MRLLIAALAPVALALAGCGAGSASGGSQNSTFSVSPGAAAIDTNCTGCNGASSSTGGAYEQFSASLASGGAANVTWSASGGDALAGAGSINSSGQYTPPSYLTANSVRVTVTAKLMSNSSVSASSTITVTPGFLQPLTPENVALGPNGNITVTGYIAEAGGTEGINYALSNAATGSSGGEGTLGSVNCVRSSSEFTNCSVTYTAPSNLSATGATYIVATVGSSSSITSSEVLLNTAGIESNPAAHQAQLSSPITLGSSGGNNDDYDTNSKDQVTDCCGGTLGSLLQSSGGTQYLLSCNHVLARSDQATAGELIVQPGLIDANCVPYDQGGTEMPVGTLSGYVKLDGTGNVDAAVAQVNPGVVNASGNILELGALGANGELASAPPGISSTGGKGETGTLSMTVAKSGRTTGLTCASIAAVDLDVQVAYYSNCAETDPYYTKTFSNQIGIEGNQFSDAGDSGSLVVDTADAEPVGLFFAGGVDQTSGVSEGIANPVADVLSELGTQMGTSYTFVGGADHAVSCLNYGNSTASSAQAVALSNSETDRIEQAMSEARMLVNPSQGILGVAMGKSSDHSGEGAVIVFVSLGANAQVPATIAGVRTVVIATTGKAVANGSAPASSLEVNQPVALSAGVLNAAVSVKQQISKRLMRVNRSFFGVGVGQSYDNPRDAVLVIYVDRRQVPALLPATVGGLRTRYIVMDRLHVTRSYAKGLETRSRCMSHAASGTSLSDPFGIDFEAHKLR
ncbi:MAG: hypothetical protein ABR928_03155 [Terracidiphilus sp.]|jgi:hypothetical protein